MLFGKNPIPCQCRKASLTVYLITFRLRPDFVENVICSRLLSPLVRRTISLLIPPSAVTSDLEHRILKYHSA